MDIDTTLVGLAVYGGKRVIMCGVIQLMTM